MSSSSTSESSCTEPVRPPPHWHSGDRQRSGIGQFAFRASDSAASYQHADHFAPSPSRSSAPPSARPRSQSHPTERSGEMPTCVDFHQVSRCVRFVSDCVGEHRAGDRSGAVRRQQLVRLSLGRLPDLRPWWHAIAAGPLGRSILIAVALGSGIVAVEAWRRRDAQRGITDRSSHRRTRCRCCGPDGTYAAILDVRPADVVRDRDCCDRRRSCPGAPMAIGRCVLGVSPSVGRYPSPPSP